VLELATQLRKVEQILQQVVEEGQEKLNLIKQAEQGSSDS
jgi:hypothetical protein